MCVIYVYENICMFGQKVGKEAVKLSRNFFGEACNKCSTLMRLIGQIMA